MMISGNFSVFDVSRNLFWVPILSNDQTAVVSGNWQRSIPEIESGTAQFIVVETLTSDTLNGGVSVDEFVSNLGPQDAYGLLSVDGQFADENGRASVIDEGSEVASFSTTTVENNLGEIVATAVNVTVPAGQAMPSGILQFVFATTDGQSIDSAVAFSVQSHIDGASELDHHTAEQDMPMADHTAMDHSAMSQEGMMHSGHDMALKMLMPLMSDGMAMHVIPSDTAVVSGDWFDPITWGASAGDWGAIPDFGALVHIPADIAVSYDFGSIAFQNYAAATSNAASHIFMVRVDGDLTLAATSGAETQLIVDTIFTTKGNAPTDLSNFVVDAADATDGTVDVVFRHFDIEENRASENGADYLPDSD